MYEALSRNKNWIIFFTIALATQVAFNFYFQRKHEKRKPRKSVNEAIFFSYGCTDVKRSKYSKCIVTPSMERLLHYLNTPKYTLDVCMYVLTNMELTNVLLKLHYRGVIVRVIIDADMAFASGSYTRRLEKQGIVVRWMKSTNLMHHKFSLIDAGATEVVSTTPLVIMGSLNWTNQALSGNWEDVAVTSQEDLVMQYRNEFERLWLLFKPVVDY